jgi:AMP-polyphosphate phosphotransferase
MFETAELGRTLTKDEYEAALPELRTRLLKAQAALENAGFSVVVLLNGVGGMAETNNRLHEWLDARYLVTETYEKPTKDELQKPEFWRYWSWLPRAGRIGIFLGSWYTRPIVEHAEGVLDDAEFARDLQRIVAFEQTLAQDGVLLIKLWLHLSKAQQTQRLEDLNKDAGTRFLIQKGERRRVKRYKDYRHTSERGVRETSTGLAPWSIIEAADARYRDVEAGKQILRVLEDRLAHPRIARIPQAAPHIDNPRTIFDTLDHARRVSKADYDTQVPKLQAKLSHVASKLQRQGKSAIIVFEGPDAAGKGGAIRRVIWPLNAQQYRIVPISSPTEEERGYHYLWRFWRHLPKRGHITIFDRSWYGRVLVERVEGFASTDEWSRAYKEINDFERELTDGGIVLIKFWLHVTSEEQLRRFQEREREPWKQHKITAEDYRNRTRENVYETAASEMIERNSTEVAPFTLVAADDKRGARLAVLQAICDRFKAAL